jgi:hypothetical protein
LREWKFCYDHKMLEESAVELIPFQACEGLRLVCKVLWLSDVLTLRYEMTGRVFDVVLPRTGGGGAPKRRDSLWKQTCLEAFLTTPSDPGYWELNLSWNGDWNAYRFSDYRQGQQTELRIDEPQGKAGISSETDFSFESRIDLRRLLLNENDRILIGISAVLEIRGEGLTYWAAKHSGEKPDFHCRESFVVER